MKSVSIIIPVKMVNDYIREAMQHYAELDYEEYEILIFPDEESEETFPNTRIIPSGPVGPAEKRDLALQYATGEIFAFNDDDAYPRADWLKSGGGCSMDIDVLRDYCHAYRIWDLFYPRVVL